MNNMDLMNLDSYFGQKSSQLNSFDTIFKFEKVSNVKRIYLKSIELPLTFTNVRSGGDFNRLTVVFNTGATFNVVLAETNYTDAQTLFDDLNSACSSIITNGTLTFSVSGNYTQVSLTSSTYTSFSFISTGLLRILGFLPNTSYTSPRVSQAYTNLSLDTYLCVYFSDVLGDGIINTSQKPMTFKIPIYSALGTVVFWEDSNSFTQFIDISNQTKDISSIRVIISDQFGNLLNSNGSDYSMTLAIEYKF